MVAVVQLVEHQVVILGVAGSSPVSHPNEAADPSAVCPGARGPASKSRQVLALPAFHTGQGTFQSPRPSVPGSVGPTVWTTSTMSPLLLWS